MVSNATAPLLTKQKGAKMEKQKQKFKRTKDFNIGASGSDCVRGRGG